MRLYITCAAFVALNKGTETAKLLYMLLIVLTCGTLNNSCVASRIEGEKN